MVFFRQVCVMLRKRLIEFIRNPLAILSSAIFGILFTILTGVASIVIYSTNNVYENVSFGDDYLVNANKIAITGENNTITNEFFSDFKQRTGYELVQIKSESDLLDELYNNSYEYIYGISVYNYSNKEIVANVYLNSTIDSQSTFQAQIIVFLLKMFNSKSFTSPSLDFTYEPLNAGISLTHLWIYFGPMLMGFALMSIATPFITVLVSDKENGRLHSLLTSGLQPFSYWFANFIFDLICYIIINTANWGVLYAFNTPAVVANNWMSTYFLIFFESFQNLALMYFMSFFFPTIESVNSFIISITTVIDLFPYWIVTLILDNDL